MTRLLSPEVVTRKLYHLKYLKEGGNIVYFSILKSLFDYAERSHERRMWEHMSSELPSWGSAFKAVLKVDPPLHE
jgi:hypothetical protein